MWNSINQSSTLGWQTYIKYQVMMYLGLLIYKNNDNREKKKEKERDKIWGVRFRRDDHFSSKNVCFNRW